MPIREVRKDGDSESEKEREVHMVKQLQELYLNMDSVCTIQFEKGGNAE